MDFWSISYLALWVLVIVQGIVLLVVLRTLGSFMLSTREAIERDGLAIGTRAPVFVAEDATGSEVRLSDVLGKWLVLLFAFPACRICRELLPDMGTLSRELGSEARVLLLLRGSLDDLRLLLEQENPTIESWAIGHHGVAERFRVRVSPFVHVIDPAGNVKAKGLVNNREAVEHLLRDAGFTHPTAVKHALPANSAS